ncbi:MAG: ACP S-malonyltransferase [candidate division WOR-3 bacterium]|uniref:Malonyl CoA-acyl carrier protein transacylase n=1 Tax=candidate division WOR-3 bacterium TaxID=2052148 RepID=A0A7V4EC82_UNCW3
MVKNYALIFTGQGSQWVGMGKKIYEKSQKFKEIFDRCEEILNLPLKKLCFEGPEIELTKTIYAQPAILSFSIGIFEIYKEKVEEKPLCAFGHSLGEFTALYAGEVLSFEDVLEIVKERGKLMHEAGEEFPGSMAAIIGVEEEEVREIIEKNKFKFCVIANYNSPSQIVISGKKEEVEEICNELKNKRKGKIIPLVVSAAFHSPLMDKPAEKFSEFLKNKIFKKPIFPIIQNATGEIETDPEKIKKNVEKQLNSPVLFTKCVESAWKHGAKCFIEIGPKKVLTRLVKEIKEEAEAIFISEEDVF